MSLLWTGFNNFDIAKTEIENERYLNIECSYNKGIQQMHMCECIFNTMFVVFPFWRNRNTPRDEFIFYSKRLMRLLFEYALSMLPHKVDKCSSQSILFDSKTVSECDGDCALKADWMGIAA